MENILVLSVLIFSGSYIVRRLGRMSFAYKNKQAACKGCAGACETPGSVSSQGEVTLPMR